MPEAESKEHIVPRWLIELTGEPKRTGVFGPFWDGKVLKMHSYSFDRFAFPACEKCNQESSELEGSASTVVSSIVDEKPLSSADLQVLLTWLDKVRIGVWLALLYMQKGLYPISPNYFIDSRLDKSDRMVLLYKSDYAGLRLQFDITGVPAFQYHPSCFYLVVNDYYFFNVATDFLLSKRMGLPYPSQISYTNTPAMKMKMHEGKERIAYPPVTLRYARKCAQIFQPMFKIETKSQFNEYYETDFVKSITLDHSKGAGKVFYYDGVRLSQFPVDKSDCWLPPKTWNDNELRLTVGKQTLEFQLHLLKYGPTDRKIDYRHISPEKRRLVREQVQLATKVNKMFLQRAIEDSTL
jgi:hypothetical protein